MLDKQNYKCYYNNKKINNQKRRFGMKSVKRGDIYYADLSPVIGCEQGGGTACFNSSK